MHILLSRSEGNQTMKFGQLIEYNIWNILVEKSYTKFGGETTLRPLSKKNKIGPTSGSIKKSFKKFVFIVCQFEGYRNIMKSSCRSLVFT